MPVRVLEALSCIRGADESNRGITGQLNGRAVSHVKLDGRGKASSAFKGEQRLHTGLHYLGEFSVLKGCNPQTLEAVLNSDIGRSNLHNSIRALHLIRKVGIAPWNEYANNLLQQKVGGVALGQLQIEGKAHKAGLTPNDMAGQCNADRFSELASQALKLRERVLFELGGRDKFISEQHAIPRSLTHRKVQEVLQSIHTSSHALRHSKDVTLSEQTINKLHDLISKREPLDPETARLLKTQGDLILVRRMADAIQTGLSPDQLARSLPVLKDVQALDEASDALQNDPTVRLDARALELLHDSIVKQQVSKAEFSGVISTRGDLDQVRALADSLNAEVGTLKAMFDSLASPQPNQLRVLEGLHCFTQSALHEWNRVTTGSAARNGDLGARQKFIWQQFRPHLARVDSVSAEAMGKHLLGNFIVHTLAILDAAVARTERRSELIAVRVLLANWAKIHGGGGARMSPVDSLTLLDELVVLRLSK